MPSQLLTCRDCGSTFDFSQNEQEFYTSRGFNNPATCRPCRLAKHKAHLDSRPWFAIVCAECGADSEVPFEPRPGQPILCRDCFRLRQGRFGQQDEAPPPVSCFEHAGIADSQGAIWRPTAGVPSRIAVEVLGINDELISWLSKEPDRMRGLPPRRFEELVAELLVRQGFEVEMTPCTSDGGLDMYAAKKNSLGRFLYLVECKRYCPSRKVGVGVVRGLYGVVQEKRANAGVIATTSFFSPAAIEYQHRIEYQMKLRDYSDLQAWLAGT